MKQAQSCISFTLKTLSLFSPISEVYQIQLLAARIFCLYQFRLNFRLLWKYCLCLRAVNKFRLTGWPLLCCNLFLLSVQRPLLAMIFQTMLGELFVTLISCNSDVELNCNQRIVNALTAHSVRVLFSDYKHCCHSFPAANDFLLEPCNRITDSWLLLRCGTEKRKDFLHFQINNLEPRGAFTLKSLGSPVAPEVVPVGQCWSRAPPERREASRRVRHLRPQVTGGGGASR